MLRLRSGKTVEVRSRGVPTLERADAVLDLQVRRLTAAEAASLAPLAAVELSFRDQYTSRAGMWRFRRALAGAVLHAGQVGWLQTV